MNDGPQQDHAYLDYNATAPLRPEARVAVAEAMAITGNPSSVHGPGRQARRFLETAREQVAALAGVAPADLTFTSGGTEANAMAIAAFRARPAFVSAIEHPSVLDNMADAARLPVTSDGLVDLDAAAALLADADAPFVAVMAANNETGVLQPIEALAGIVHGAGGVLLVDAIQRAGKLPLAPVAAVADLMTLSAHKLGGPSGVGALAVRPGLDIAPLYAGGGQERRRRSGTENLPGIAGFGAAAAAAMAGLEQGLRIARLRDTLETGVRGADVGAVIYGGDAPRLPNTSCIGLPGVSGETQVMSLDLAGVAVSAGSACSSGKVQRSHVLDAMGAPDGAAGEAIRVSLGWASTPADVERFLAAWGAMAAKSGQRKGQAAA